MESTILTRCSGEAHRASPPIASWVCLSKQRTKFLPPGGRPYQSFRNTMSRETVRTLETTFQRVPHGRTVPHGTAERANDKAGRRVQKYVPATDCLYYWCIHTVKTSRTNDVRRRRLLGHMKDCHGSVAPTDR